MMFNVCCFVTTNMIQVADNNCIVIMCSIVFMCYPTFNVYCIYNSGHQYLKNFSKQSEDSIVPYYNLCAVVYSRGSQCVATNE